MRKAIGAAVASLAMLTALHGSAMAAVGTEGDGVVETENVYVHSEVGEPWGDDDNDVAMDAVFGTDGWDEEHFETAPGAAVFGDGVRFVFLDGSDDGAEALEAFLAANGGALDAFLARGGRLFLNAAPNVGDGLSYGGFTVHYDDIEDAEEVVATAPGHAIFSGPFAPTATAYSGNAFAHAVVTGPGLVPLIARTEGDAAGAPADPSAIVLGEARVGCGVVLLGGMTMPSFHEPEAEAQSLRNNIVHYAAKTASCGFGPAPAAQVFRPTVTAVGPAGGSAGTGVTITGAGFQTVTKVLFGDVPAQFVVDGHERITAVAPAGVAGTVDVLVENQAGVSDPAPGARFTYEADVEPLPFESPSTRALTCPRVPTLVGYTMRKARRVLALDGCAAPLERGAKAASAKKGKKGRKGKRRIAGQTPEPGTPLYDGDVITVTLG